MGNVRGEQCEGSEHCFHYLHLTLSQVSKKLLFLQGASHPVQAIPQLGWDCPGTFILNRFIRSLKLSYNKIILMLTCID